MVMDQKMSVGLDSSAVGIGLSAPWLPTPSPLKLPTPTLEQLANSDWALAQNTSSSLPQASTSLPLSGSALNLGISTGTGTGFSPRFSPDILRMSPGVSGSLAGNLQPDGQKNSATSLAELFMTNEYSISTPTPPAQHSSSDPTQKDVQQSQHNEDSRQSRTQPAKSLQNQQQLKTLNAQAPLASQSVVSRPLPQVSARQMPQMQHPPKHEMVAQASAPYQTHHLDQREVNGNRSSNAPAQAYARHGQVVQAATGVGTSAPFAYARPLQPAQVLGQSMPPPTMPPPSLSSSQAYANVPQAGPSQTQPPLHTQAATQLPPRPQAKPLSDDNRQVAQSGAIVEAQRNAQEKADQFAMSRKRERKEHESDKPKDVDVEDDSKLSPAELKRRRYNRRLELNRQSAAVSRVRRRAYVKELEEKLVSVEREKVRLERQVTFMHDENTRLREQMRQLHDQLGGPPGTAS